MSQIPSQTHHNEQLQSLRGIAAMVVVIHHGLRTIDGADTAIALSEVPFNAGAAVILFFVLSGYVLALSLQRRGTGWTSLTEFFVRRAFRIYPALWVGTALGAMYLAYKSVVFPDGLFVTVRGHYALDQLGVSPVLQSIAGLKSYLLPPSWTITVELVAACIIPLFFVIFRHSRMATVLVIAGFAALALLSGTALRYVPFHLVYFAFGVAIAVSDTLRSVRVPGVAAMLATAYMMADRLLLPMSPTLFWAVNLGEGFAATVLICFLIQRRVTWLSHRWTRKIGDWSYSIYLLHLPILYTIATWLLSSGAMPERSSLTAGVVTLLTIPLTIILSSLVFEWVEKPGIAAGSRWLRWRRARDKPAADNA